MKIRIKYFALSLFLISFIVIIYMLLWGKLFPYSPIIIGFDKYELNNTIIYVQQGVKFNEFTRLDTLTKSVESFHELKFINKPKIFIFKDNESYYQRSISKARFCAFSSGALIISPWALKEDKQGIISLEIYIKHELSHILIYNYNGFLGEFKYPGWLLEGLAMYSVNQMGTSFYPSIENTYKAIREGNFMPPEYFKTNKEDEININVKYKIAFIYSEFGCIVDYLVKTFGRKKFIKYIKALLEKNDNESEFRKVYSRDFNEVISEFKEYVNKTKN